MGNKKETKKKKVEEEVEEEDGFDYQEGYLPEDENKDKVIFRQEKGFAVLEVDGDIYCVNSTQVKRLGALFTMDNRLGR